MKKKVRIYKAPNGNGKYVNKTSKFLSKAQMGGTPDPSMLAYPGAQPVQEQDQTNQLIQFIINDITSKVEKEKTIFKLINIMGLPMDAATQLYSVVAEKITEDIEKQDDAVYEEETGQPRKKEDRLTEDAVIAQRPEEEDEDFDYDLYSTTGRDIVMEESNEPDILDQALDPLAEQRYGGITRTYQYGGTYENALPDAETYESLVEPMTGYDMISQMAWNSETEDEESPYSGNYANTTLDYSKLQNGGAYKREKKKYVNSVMKLLKKQMGGDNGSDVNPNQGDPTGANFREGKLKMFTNSLKNNAQMVAMQNQIEQQYDQMMQEGGISMPEQDVENPMHHLNLYSQTASGIFGNPMNETVKAQFGLNTGRLNRSDIPRGFYRRTMRRFGNIPNLREVDVRKSGLFGPKQYTMYFDPLPLQQLNNPITAGMYGYGSTSNKKITKTPAKVVYKNAIIKDINNQSLKEVDKSTPGSDATKTEETKQETITANTPVGGGAATSPVVTQPVTRLVTPPAAAPVIPPSNQYTFPTSSNQMDWAPGVTKIQQGIENPTLPENQYNQALPGKFSTYRYVDGEWQYRTGEEPPRKVTYQPTLDRLNNSESINAVYGTLDANPGYYYRLRNDGSFAKYKGDPKKHNKSSRPVSYITKDDKNYKYLKNNFRENDYLLNYHQQGGSIENPFSNPFDQLQKFIGGGYDSTIPDLTEDNIQYVNSKDITDPYMQDGGLIKSLVPANLVRSGSNDVVQRIYNPVTGQTYTQAPASAARQIAAIDVKKRGITGRPKKYTVYYGAPGSMPPRDTKEQNNSKKEVKVDAAASARQTALENAGYGQRTDVTGLKGKSKRAIKQGERQRDKELEKLYEEDPTNIAFTKIDENAPFDRTASNNSAYYLPDLTETTAEEDFAAWGTPKDAMEQTNAYIFPEGESDDSGWGTPRDMVVDSTGAPVSTPTQANTPAPIAKPATGKQTEEFCFGNSCFSLPDQQLIEGHLFLDTPDLLSSYAYDNNSDWYDKEKREFDLSKVDKETLKKALRSENAYADIPDENLDAYADAWLKYQQGNQNAYGKQTIETLGKDPSALESFGFAEKYADFLNATGQTAEGKPFSIWDTTGPLQQTPEQVAARRIQAPYMKNMTSEFGPTSMEGPVATEQDQILPFEQEYMQGYEPTITQEMLDNAAQLQLPTPMTNIGAWSGMDYPAELIQPGVNPFDLPVSGGENYYPPFAQPVAPSVAPSAKPKQNKTQSLDEWRASERRRSNYGKTYTYKPNMTGVEKDPDYRRAMQEARKDGVVTNQEANNATRIYKQKQAEQEKAKIADQAQRTINQIMSTSASAAEKNKAREKVILQMQQRWDTIDRAVNSKKYGGALSRFVNGGNNQPFTGDNPVVYANNPAIEGAQGQINWNQMSSPGLVTQMNNDGTKSYGVDATYQGLQPFDNRERMEKMPTLSASAGLRGFAKGTDQLAGVNTPLAVDVKNKLTQGEREARLIAGNTLLRGIAGYKNRLDDTKQMEGFYDNFTADNLYASDPSRDRGDYAESGLYRPDEQGQTWYGRSAQMGGYIDDDFEDGEEVYMTDEEIKQYMANGGQIEFI